MFFHSDNLVIFKFRNSKFDLKDKFVNNYKTRMLADFEKLKKSFWGSNFIRNLFLNSETDDIPISSKIFNQNKKIKNRILPRLAKFRLLRPKIIDLF